MNGSFYQNPTFPSTTGMESTLENQENTLKKSENNTIIKVEEYIKKNYDKKYKLYANFSNSNAWQNKIFEGSIEYIDSEFLVLKDLTNLKYILKIKNIDYIEIYE